MCKMNKAVNNGVRSTFFDPHLSSVQTAPSSVQDASEAEVLVQSLCWFLLFTDCGVKTYGIQRRDEPTRDIYVVQDEKG